MPNVASIEKVRRLVAALDDGMAIRQAAYFAGVAKATAGHYRREWLLGGSPEQIRERVMAQNLIRRKAATGGHYTCGRKMNEPAEPG